MSVDLISALEARRTSLESLVPQGIEQKRMVDAAIAAARDPNLRACKPVTVGLAIRQAIELGLWLSDGLDHCYLVPYRQECQLIIGYRGLCALAYRSGVVRRIEANVVREGDDFEYAYGTKPYLEHRPSGENGALKAAWAIAWFADGSSQFVVMAAHEVRAIEANAPGRDSVWKNHADQMWTKTAVKRLCKLLPLTAENDASLRLAAALKAETQHEIVADSPPPAMVEEGHFGQVAPPEENGRERPSSRTDRLKQKLAAPTPPPAEPEPPFEVNDEPELELPW